MADQTKHDADEASDGGTTSTDKQEESGDPGRTPGKAEGDEETVDESLRNRESEAAH